MRGLTVFIRQWGGMVAVVILTACGGYALQNLAVPASAGDYSARDIIPGDLDDDGDVDVDDLDLFAGCMHGPDIPELSQPCGRGHFDLDPDLDLNDFLGFQIEFTGPMP